MNPGLTKTYTAAGAIAASRFVKIGGADWNVLQATDGSAAIFGVTEVNVPAASGDSVDVIKEGIAYLELGDAVTRGQYLTADANGKGIPAVIVAGTPLYVGAKAEVSGVAGDIIPVHVYCGVIANDSAVVSADIVISTAQLLALHATPHQLIAAPGAGKAIIPVSIEAYMPFNSVAYDGVAGGEDLEIRHTDGAGQIFGTIETTGFIDQGTDQTRYLNPLAAAASNPVANAALVMCLASGEIASGNSPLHVRVRYRVIDLAF